MHIIVDCARETDGSIAHYRRLRPPESCARHADASIRVSFWTKNRAQSSVLLLQITADCARRTYGHFFDFDNYIYRLETPIILPTRSTLRPDPSLRLRQSFARLLRSFSLHPVSVFVWVRPAFRSRAVGGVSSRGAAPNPAKTLCCIISNFECLWVLIQLKVCLTYT